MTGENARAPRALVISGAIQSAIAQLLAVERWLDAGGRDDALDVPDRPFTVDLGALAAAEAALGARLGDDALALLAAGSRVLARRFGITVEELGAHTERAREAGCPRSLVAIGSAGRDSFVCVSTAAGAGERPRIWSYTTGSMANREPLDTWLRAVIEHALDDLELSEGQWRRIESDEAGARFVPRLIAGDPMAAPDAAIRRVSHPKFGEGAVVREIHEGAEPKLEIDFGAGGRRILLARFVRELDRAS